MSQSLPFDQVTENELRRRQSAKWKLFPADVLPAWVAEMDFPLADPIRAAIALALDANDLGYADPRGLGESFAAFAAREWQWTVAAGDVRVTPDVVGGIEALLAVCTDPGDAVVIDSPVYHPFAGTIRALGRKVVPVSLVASERGDANASYGGRLAPDLSGIAAAYAAGARAHLFCSPHNPAGTVHPRAVLAEIAALARKHDVLVLSDEIHAPLTLPGATHVPFPAISSDAAECSIVLTSASKTWNIAGLKAAVIVAQADRTRAFVNKLPPEMPYHAGHLGVLASRAAFLEGEPWRGQVIAMLDRNRTLLADLLREHLPSIGYVPPAAGYLAWLDCRALGLGPDPAKAFLAKGRVALSQGPMFGAEGEGFARLNIGTTRTLIEEAVLRMARAARS